MKLLKGAIPLMLASGTGWMLVVALSLASGGDPRVPILELQIERDHEAALVAVEQTLVEQPELASRLGLHYLRGHLLLQMERPQEALQAFARTMSTTPQLDAYSRYRIAVEQDRMGHPEVAAGLLATLLGSDGPPKPLIAPAARLLRRTLAEGGDCRLLRSLDFVRFPDPSRRQLAYAKAWCQARADASSASVALHELLEAEYGDEVARLAAEALIDLEPDLDRPRSAFLIGLALHQHREFDRAIKYLARAVSPTSSSAISRKEGFEVRYALARSHFWEERYQQAATAFGALAAATQDPYRRSQVLYQQARCFELAGDWPRAAAVFQLAYQADPRGSWAGAAVMSFMRLKWLAGDEAAALEALSALADSRHAVTYARALLFLTSSDLVSSRADRADRWLSSIPSGQVPKQEITYWQGRVDELAGRADKAVESYLQTLKEDPFQPFGQAAQQRLGHETLRAATRRLRETLAASSRGDDLYAAWLLVGNDDAGARRTRAAVQERLGADHSAGAYLELRLEPTASWQLWRANLSQPEEKLLALGLFAEGGSMLMRHFPVANPSLAFTGSLALARAGEIRRSLYIAEILSKRVPRRMPQEMLPRAYRELLFPLGYGELVFREADRHDIDPYLLSAIIREESRFDPRAFSAASARGLTQFIFPTARRVAHGIGLGKISPDDLDRPEIAIALGAGYLREPADRFNGKERLVVAAYNSGEPPATLWNRYCHSDELVEYLTKAAFQETRSYLSKVLTSRAHYRDIYGQPREPAE